MNQTRVAKKTVDTEPEEKRNIKSPAEDGWKTTRKIKGR
jgi:hypothetical protein